MADMLAAAYAVSGSAHREQWRVDNWSAVCAQIGAAHAVTSGVVNGLLMDAVTLRERLPRVGAVFAEGLIAYRLVHLICARTMLVTDPEALRAVDNELADQLRQWGAKSMDQAERDIDTLVLCHDPDAVRRTESSNRGAYVEVNAAHATGTAYVSATVSLTDGEAFDRRADALARTVCARDPRTLDQRRGAALGAMGFGWDRLPCMCENDDCDAAAKPPVGGVVVHVVVRQDTLDAGEPDGPSNPGGPSDPDGIPQNPSDPQHTGVPGGGPEGAEDSQGRPETADNVDGHADGTPDPAGAHRLEPETTSTTTEPTADQQPCPAAASLTAQRRALVGDNPPLLPKPWYSYTLRGLLAALTDGPGQFSTAGPAAILGGAVIPAPVAAQLAMHATIRPLIHPGQAPPEPRYRPSRTLAEFIRCRDQTCRFPGCTRPATITDIDHTIPYPYGPTCASNLVCLCREHHLLKTFWPGWSTQQFPDGTLVWTDPEGQRCTTYPGSRLLFPELCAPTAAVVNPRRPPPKHTAGLTMPKRTITRADARRQRIDDERRLNAA
ncbi:HNH nuclease [Mycolicibacterium aurum]|uniref:HNH nuclease n=4 Tax=Mycolicibacterium aurum TaxID=1791 RepID=A0A448J1K6_MYCAU|nr:HNH nuclease [Mycolicibacterium aurum]